MEVSANDIALALSIVGAASTLWWRQNVSRKEHKDETVAVTKWRTETDSRLSRLEEDWARDRELLFAKLKEIATLLTQHCQQCAGDKGEIKAQLDGIDSRMMRVEGSVERLHSK